ncbi:MAG: hypothetical protein IKT94_02675, partial [Rikenellaceae bacterium]|nr:hypothetical protein [Rikenellaceae bacterium]
IQNSKFKIHDSRFTIKNSKLAISEKSSHAVAPATFSRAAPRHRVRKILNNASYDTKKRAAPMGATPY